jgi:hypothetical protein
VSTAAAAAARTCPTGGGVQHRGHIERCAGPAAADKQAGTAGQARWQANRVSSLAVFDSVCGVTLLW